MKNIILSFALLFSFTAMAEDGLVCSAGNGDQLDDLSQQFQNLQERLDRAGFENCNLDYQASKADLGMIGVCQSSSDESRVRLVSSSEDRSTRTCLIPTYKDATGASTYLGDPQCTYTEKGKVISGRLFKDRKSMSNYPINGVIVIKERLLEEYFVCMDSYSKYISYYCPYNADSAECKKGAEDHKKSACDSFKAKNSENFLDLRLK